MSKSDNYFFQSRLKQMKELGFVPRFEEFRPGKFRWWWVSLNPKHDKRPIPPRQHFRIMDTFTEGYLTTLDGTNKIRKEAERPKENKEMFLPYSKLKRRTNSEVRGGQNSAD